MFLLMQCATCNHQNPSGAKFCSACAAPLDVSSTDEQTSFLPQNTRLQNGAYAVGSVLGQGGFGITYKGGDLSLRRYVAIKEFFPQGAIRQNVTIRPDRTLSPTDYNDIKVKFIDEAHRLARFSHPAIVRVYGVFEENNTAYMVMEFLEGQSLAQKIEQNGPLSENEVVDIATKVGDALSAVHAAELIHRDIKPDNIMLTNDGRVVLIDFGTARSFASDKTVKQTAMLTPGYAPLEQYGHHARFGAFTDIYALGATLYHAVTGQMPPPATDIASGVDLKPPAAINPLISQNVSNAIMRAMRTKSDQRPQTVDAFLEVLKKAGVSSQPGTVADPSNPHSSDPHHSNPPQPTLQPTDVDGSGLGDHSSALPLELNGFNWGATLAPVFWGVAHSSWVALWILIIGGAGALFGSGGPLTPATGVVSAISIGFCIWMGTQGNELAWRNRKWSSISQFRHVQKQWTTWGIVIFALSFVASFAASTFYSVNQQVDSTEDGSSTEDDSNAGQTSDTADSAAPVSPASAAILATPQDRDVYEQGRALVLAQFKSQASLEILHYDEEVKQEEDLEKDEDHPNAPTDPVTLVSNKGANQWTAYGLLSYSGPPGSISWGQGTIYLKGNQEPISGESSAGWIATLNRDPSTGQWTLVKIEVRN